MVVIDNKNFYIVKAEIVNNIWKVKTNKLKRAINENKNLFLVDVFNCFTSSTFAYFEIEKYKEETSEYVYFQVEEEKDLILPPIIGNATFKMDDSWINLLFDYFLTADFQNYMNEIKELENAFPLSTNRWNVFVTDVYNLKAVIISEHSYPNKHNNGIAFSTFEKEKPKSFLAIEEGIKKEKGMLYSLNSSLIDWQTKGVLLLNKEFINGHYNHNFFSTIIEKLLKVNPDLYWMLVGKGLWYLQDILPKNKLLFSEHPLEVLKRKEVFNSNKFLELDGKINYL